MKAQQHMNLPSTTKVSDESSSTSKVVVSSSKSKDPPSVIDLLDDVSISLEIVTISFPKLRLSAGTLYTSSDLYCEPSYTKHSPTFSYSSIISKVPSENDSIARARVVRGSVQRSVKMMRQHVP